MGISPPLLGGFKVVGSIAQNANYNDFIANGQYLFDTWQATGSNYPFINGYGVMFVYSLVTIVYQICFDFDGGRIALRRYSKNVSTWSGWKIISGT